MAEVSTADLEKILKSVQKLRTSVSQVFTKFREGMRSDPSPEDNDRIFLNELQQGLVIVNQEFSDIMKGSNNINPPSGQILTGNSMFLNLDPVLDKTPLGSQLQQAYKWSNKMHGHCTQAAHLLNQNSLKRSNASGGVAAKRRPVAHTIQPGLVDQVVTNLNRTHQVLNISLSRPMGNAAVLEVTVAKTLKAVIVLRGLIIENVIVLGYGEENMKEGIKELDMWYKSKYKVFQTITEHANAAMLHFYLPLVPELAIRSFMTWLSSYTSLFTAPCVKCGRHLQDNLPPTWREFRTLKAYHEGCR